jgi:hypothetical protein
MPDKELTEADDTAGDTTFDRASISGPRQVTPHSMSADLSPALAMPTTFCTKLFEITVLIAIVNTCKPVKDAGDLLLLRETLIQELGPAYMWLIMLSFIEGATLHLHVARLALQVQQSLGICTPTLALEAPQEEDRSFCSSSPGVYENQTRIT